MDPKPETNPLPQSVRDNLYIANTLIDVGLRADCTIDRRFRDLTDPKIPANSTPVDGVKSYDVTINDPCWFRVYVPDATTKNLPLVVYYHGGGFAYYGPDSAPFDGLCRRFASRFPAIVVSASYRLIPEYRYPAQYEDGFNVLKFLDDSQNRNKLPKNADLKNCFVFGDSAGANLAHQVCVRAAGYKFQHIKVMGLVALQPYFGGEQRVASEISSENRLGLHLNQTDFYWNVFQPHNGDEKWDRDNEVINVSGPNAIDLTVLDFPTTLVVIGGRDILEDRQRNYFVWLKNSGKEAYMEEYKYMFHAFYTFPELPEAIHVLSVIKEFINKQMKMNTTRQSRL
ncbi:hypothetical protein R6Q59_002626 [Mikania micrantha]|uniref:Alpha/beta hydrolase fold-3 domain-containing protein n=1 Tax=Mikania micrantha TaxID=192012 RepID=A0A5N6NNT4_9ASTR|nr:hypothetical protein E3N88_19648 [Mikania micrantha]